MSDRLLPAHITIWAAYPEYAADPLRPTAAELNNADMVFNISCAVLDDYTLNQTESDTDDTRSVCDVGEVNNPTFYNYEASFDLFRDKSLTDNGVFNRARELFTAPDREFYLIKRIGEENATAAAADQDVSVYGVKTDNPVDVVEDGALLRHGARFKTTGKLNVKHTLLAGA